MGVTLKGENKTKIKIRETAIKLFENKSFEEVTITDICKESGITKHTFYYYFKSKDDLLDQFYKMPTRLTEEEITSILTTDNCVEQYWMLIKKFVDFANDKGIEIFKQVMIKNLTKDQGTFQFDTEEKIKVIKLEAGIIKKGQSLGQFESKIPPEELGILFHQIIPSSMFIWVTKNGEIDIENLIRYQYEVLFQVREDLKKAKKLPVFKKMEL